MTGHGPESLSAVLAVVWECQQRVEDFALPFALESDDDELTPPGLHVQIDDAAGLPEIRLVKLLHVGSDDLYLVLRLQTPDDGYRVSAEILTDQNTIYTDERKTDSLAEALTELRALTGDLCAEADLLDRQVVGSAGSR